jgi:hypothetical protein
MQQLARESLSTFPQNQDPHEETPELARPQALVHAKRIRVDEFPGSDVALDSQTSLSVISGQSVLTGDNIN